MAIFRGVLIFFIVVLAILGMSLASRMVGVQTSWSKKIDELRKQNETAAATLAKKEADLVAARAEVTRSNLGWDRSWPGTTVGRRPDGATLDITGVGSNTGLTVRTANDDQGQPQQTLPMLYVFGPAVDGSGMEFLGEFSVDVAAVGADRCQAEPTFQPRQGEAQAWPAGAGFRVRTQIPSHYKTRFDGFRVRFTNNDAQLAAKAINLNKQNDLFNKAQDELNVRQKELGFGEPTGLVPEIERAEEERNDLQLFVDRLRRDIKQALDRRDTLEQDNRRLVGRLPQVAKTKPESPAGQRVSRNDESKPTSKP